jgi:CW_7 repeat
MSENTEATPVEPEIIENPTVDPIVTPSNGTRKSQTQIAGEVWAGKWGSHSERVDRLTAEGYNAKFIQDLVNKGVGKASAL